MKKIFKIISENSNFFILTVLLVSYVFTINYTINSEIKHFKKGREIQPDLLSLGRVGNINSFVTVREDRKPPTLSSFIKIRQN